MVSNYMITSFRVTKRDIDVVGIRVLVGFMRFAHGKDLLTISTI